MKHLLIALMLVLAISTTASAQDNVVEAFFTGETMQKLAEQPLLPPFFALKYLRGEAYSAWCLLHNKAERERVAENREPGRLITVFDMRGEIYGNQTYHPYYGNQTYQTYHPYYGTINVGDTRYNRTETTRTYEIGGYGGGPMTIYNPYFIPD